MLAAAAGKSKRAIEELVAALSPQPPVPPSIRKLPVRAHAVAGASPLPAEPVGPPADDRCAPTSEPPSLPLAATETPWGETSPLSLPPAPRRPAVKPLSTEAYRVEFTADRSLKAKLEQAEELMRHRVGKGNLVAVIESALDLLIAEVSKERFGVGRKPRSAAAAAQDREVVSRHIPDAIKRVRAGLHGSEAPRHPSRDG